MNALRLRLRNWFWGAARSPGSWVVLSLLLWPLSVQWWAAQVLTSIDYWEEQLTQWRRAPPAEAPPKLAPVTELERPVDFEEPLSEASAPPSATGKQAPSGKQKPTARRGVRVREASILRLARARAIPDSVAVSAQGARPAGLMLIGISGFGVGMQDGDVITQVSGVPVGSRSEIVTQVLQARARKAPAMFATFWRTGTPWSLVVEMPYPSERSADGVAGTAAKTNKVRGSSRPRGPVGGVAVPGVASEGPSIGPLR